MREDLIYFHTKKWFTENGYILIGGQPPNGSDRIPVIEIKTSENIDKGSKGVYKPDLLVATNAVFIIIECKPLFSLPDIEKLTEIMANPDRQRMLFSELLKRNAFERKGLSLDYGTFTDFQKKLRYCISYGGEPIPRKDLYSLVHRFDEKNPTLWLGGVPVKHFTLD